MLTYIRIAPKTSVNESFDFVLTSTSFIQCSISIDYHA